MDLKVLFNILATMILKYLLTAYIRCVTDNKSFFGKTPIELHRRTLLLCCDAHSI